MSDKLKELGYEYANDCAVTEFGFACGRDGSGGRTKTMDITDRELTDEEREIVTDLMRTIEDLPRESVNKIIQHIIRSGVYYKRTKDVQSVLHAVRSVFTVIRHRRDPVYQAHLAETPARKHPATDEEIAALLERLSRRQQ